MEAVLELLKSPSIKRLLVLLVTSAVVALNKKLGLSLSDVDIASLAGLVGAYLLQSGIKAAAVAKADGEAAAAKVDTLEAAAAELSK